MDILITHSICGKYFPRSNTIITDKACVIVFNSPPTHEGSVLDVNNRTMGPCVYADTQHNYKMNKLEQIISNQ